MEMEVLNLSMNFLFAMADQAVPDTINQRITNQGDLQGIYCKSCLYRACFQKIIAGIQCWKKQY